LISAEQQQAYMKQFSDYFYICLYGEEPAGYIGVIEDDIRVATHPKFQNSGIASFMINNIKTLFPKASAKIKISNNASLAVFKKCGFEVKYYLLEQKNE